MVAHMILLKTFRAPMRNGGDGSDHLWDLNSARFGILTERLSAFAAQYGLSYCPYSVNNGFQDGFQ